MPPEATTSIACSRPSHVYQKHHHQQRKQMEFAITKKRLIYFLVLILVLMSVFRLLRIAITMFSPPTLTLLPSILKVCDNSTSSACKNISSSKSNPSKSQTSSPSPAISISILTTKEYRFLSDLIHQRAPCNLLIFGLEPQYLLLSKINSAGTTIILEDDPEKLRLLSKRSKPHDITIIKVSYEWQAKQAFKLLEHFRKQSSCLPHLTSPQSTSCKLALKNLPKEVYRRIWDIIVVDGPSSDGPEAPGRMSAIYSASLLARNGNVTNVVVHDTDRTIERWYSWEFLCDKNLVSSKGKFWNFKIGGDISNSSTFCRSEKVSPANVLNSVEGTS